MPARGGTTPAAADPGAGAAVSAGDGKCVRCGAARRGTYTDGEHRPSPVHGVPVRPRADVCQVLPIARQSQLLVHELGKCPHPVWAAANADELDAKYEHVGTF